MNLNAVYGGLSNVASGTTATNTVPPPPPPPPPSSGQWPNEPAGFTPVTERSFDLLTEASWFMSGPLTIVADPTAPKSPSLVGQIPFPAGFSGGYDPGFPAIAGANSRGYTQRYVSFWGKRPAKGQGATPRGKNTGSGWLAGN